MTSNTKMSDFTILNKLGKSPCSHCLVYLRGLNLKLVSESMPVLICIIVACVFAFYYE